MTSETYSNINKSMDSQEELLTKQNVKTPKKKLSKAKKKEKVLTYLFIIGLLIYPIAQWAVFWLYVNIRTFILPFQQWDFWEGTYYFLEGDELFYNFKQQIEGFLAPGAGAAHGLVWNSFFNTFHALWINLIILPIATIIGYALAKHVPGEKIFRVVFFTPNMISTVVMCIAFKYMLEGNMFVGPVTQLLQDLGINYTGWDMTNEGLIWTLIYIYCIWTGLSINVVLISGAFQRIPKEIIESAKLDGVSFIQEFIKIEVPLIMPTITTFLINSVIAVAGFYMQPYLLLENVVGPNGTYSTIPWLIFNLTQNADQSSYILIATIGIMFSAILFPLIMLARFIGKKLTPDVEF